MITASAARQHFSEVLETAKGGARIVIEKNRKPQAAVVSLADLRLLEAIEDQMDIEAANASLRRMKGKHPRRIKGSILKHLENL